MVRSIVVAVVVPTSVSEVFELSSLFFISFFFQLQTDVVVVLIVFFCCCDCGFLSFSFVLAVPPLYINLFVADVSFLSRFLVYLYYYDYLLLFFLRRSAFCCIFNVPFSTVF